MRLQTSSYSEERTLAQQVGFSPGSVGVQLMVPGFSSCCTTAAVTSTELD
jgi:hypothetical protein